VLTASGLAPDLGKSPGGITVQELLDNPLDGLSAEVKSALVPFGMDALEFSAFKVPFSWGLSSMQLQ